VLRVTQLGPAVSGRHELEGKLAAPHRDPPPITGHELARQDALRQRRRDTSSGGACC
jgi:hypothetical protein